MAKSGRSKGRVQPSSPIASRRRIFSTVRLGVVGIAEMPPDFNVQMQERYRSPGIPAGLPLHLLGTGFKVAEPDVYLTARHVVDKWARHADERAAKKKSPDYWLAAIEVHPSELDGDIRRWTWGIARIPFVVGSPSEDIAGFQAPRGSDGSSRPIAPLTLSRTFCEEGDEVATCGYPFGLELHDDLLGGNVITPSFSQGIVSAALPFPDAPPSIRTEFQIDAMINGGNSGGPVFETSAGRVVGIIVAAGEVDQKLKKLPTIEVPYPTGLARAAYIHRSEEIIARTIDQAKHSATPPHHP